MASTKEQIFEIQNFIYILSSEKKGSYICPNCNNQAILAQIEAKLGGAE